MIHADAAMALGLGGGAIVGLALRGAWVANRIRAVVIAAGMAMLALTVLVTCAVAWTHFTEYTGTGGWVWFGVGLLVGLIVGEVAVRVGSRHPKVVGTRGRRASR